MHFLRIRIVIDQNTKQDDDWTKHDSEIQMTEKLITQLMHACLEFENKKGNSYTHMRYTQMASNDNKRIERTICCKKGYCTDVQVQNQGPTGGGGVAPFWGSANFTEMVSCDMGSRSDRIGILCGMGPLYALTVDIWKIRTPTIPQLSHH